MRAAGITALLLAAAAASLAPILAYPFGRDQGAFACVADVILRGGTPYRDAWEIKPPGIYYLFSASFALFGRSMLAPRLLDLVWSLAAAGLLFSVGKRLLSLLAGTLGAFFFLVFYALGFDYWTTTQCDGFASLPIAAAAAALVAAERRRSPGLAVLCGALIGIAITIKFTLGAFLLLPCLAALFAREETSRARAARTGAYVGGCFGVLGIVAALMWLSGAWYDMVYLLFTWNAKYAALRSRVPMTIRIPHETFRFLLAGQYWILRAVGLLGLIGAGDLVFRPAAGRARWLIPTWALLMLAGLWVQAKFHPYHWLPLLPPLGLLAGHGLAAARRWIRDTGTPQRAGALAVAGAALLVAMLASGYSTHFQVPIRHALGRSPQAESLKEFGEYGQGDFSLAADLEVSRFLRENSAADEAIYVWGFEPLVYFLADRRPASRFITLQPLVSPWSPPEWRQELIRDLDRERAAYILVLHNDVFPWVTASRLDSAAQLLHYPELQLFLRENYRPDRQIEHFEVWKRM